MKIGRTLHLGLMAGVAAVATSMPSSLGYLRRLWSLMFTAIGLGLVLALSFAQGVVAQQNPVTAVDIALEPDATMVQHAKAANARLLKSFPKGFALDATHHPHVTMLQQFVRTDDLDKVFAAANAVLAKEKPTAWTLKAFKYYYIPAPPFGLAGIVVEPTEDLHRLQDALIKAVEPYTVKTGTPAAFFSEEGGRDIQKDLIEYVANFVTVAAGKKFNPHVTIGVGTETYLNKCWRSHSRRSRFRRSARRSISLAPLAQPGRNSGR